MSKQINANDYGIKVGEDITKALKNLLIDLRADKSEKTLVFDKGEYFINSDDATKEIMHVTNTVGDNEWRTGEARYLNCVAMDINGIENLTIEADGARFIMRGMMTNIAIRNSRNIAINGLRLSAENPNMHELKVIARGDNYIDFELDRESRYELSDGKYYFVGKDYKTAFDEGAMTTHWNAKIPHDNANSIWRVPHPLRWAKSIKELSEWVFRVEYSKLPNAEIDDRFCVFEGRRMFQGIFAEKSDGISLNGIEQNFNYGLSTVFQDSSDISITNCRFVPSADGAKSMASVADFIQVCMCRGKIVIKGNKFLGAGDDTLNVHGIHFPALKIGSRKMRLWFSHRQTHGFLPFRAGDKIKFINWMTMLEEGENEVVSAELVSDKCIILTLKEPIKALITVVENVSATPETVEFSDNFMSRIITRGILLTTSNVTVENNVFDNTSMHSILISDDARSWYESGMVDNIVIRNNVFRRTVGYTVQVKPENIIHKGYVHKNIVVENNTIESNGEGGFYLKSTSGITVKNNNIVGKTLDTYIKNCANIDIDLK